jgi:HK97 family phage major capsid protein
MPATSVELREKRAGLIANARETWSAVEAHEGDPTVEERANFDAIMADADRLLERAKRIEQLESAEADLDAPGERASKPLNGEHREKRAGTLAEYRGSPGYVAIYRDWLRTGHIAYDRIPGEYRDTILGTDAKGGFLSTPVQLANELVKAVDDMVFVRQLATKVILTDAKSLGIPLLTTRMADANWTTEVGPVTEDTTMAFGRRDLTPTPLTKLSKVSIRMLYAATGIETFIRNELSYKFGITEEKAYLTGSGTNQPLGVFTASANGVTTARDVSTGNTATAIVADNLFENKYSLKGGYLADPSCRWVFHRTAIKSVSLLKDSTNQYLWQPGLQAGQPDRLLGIPVVMSEYAPNTFTTGLYVGLLGAFRYYWIAEVDDLQIQRLVELYSATNEVGFIGRRFLDGAPVLAEAFSRIKLG